jgi:hypothetical protein
MQHRKSAQSRPVYLSWASQTQDTARKRRCADDSIELGPFLGRYSDVTAYWCFCSGVCFVEERVCSLCSVWPRRSVVTGRFTFRGVGNWNGEGGGKARDRELNSALTRRRRERRRGGGSWRRIRWWWWWWWIGRMTRNNKRWAVYWGAIRTLLKGTR